MPTASPPRTTDDDARHGGFVEFGNVQGIVGDLRAGDRTSYSRAVLYLALSVVLVAAVTIALVLAFPSARGWEQTSGGQDEAAGWDAAVRTDAEGASIRLRGGLFDRSTVDLLSPGPGNSVRPAVQELNEGAFVTGLTAGHVEAVRVVGADMVLGDVEPVEGGIFIIPVGSERTSALEVEGIDADGRVLGTWDPQDLSHRR